MYKCPNTQIDTFSFDYTYVLKEITVPVNHTEKLFFLKKIIPASNFASAREKNAEICCQNSNKATAIHWL